MDFERMKRRELQALCKRHGLPAGGSNADLAARLAPALSVDAGAEEEVVARKGCLKRSRGGSSSGEFDEPKKVTFVLQEEAEVSGRRLRSRVIWSPVIAKTRGGRKAEKMLPAKQVSGRGRQRKLVEVPDESADDDAVAGEAGGDALVRRSRRNSVKSDAVGGVESRNNSSMAEEEGEEVVREASDRKRKRKTQEKAEDIAVSAQVGVSCRLTRRSSLSGAALLLSPVVEKKKKAEDIGVSAQVGVSYRVTRRSSLSGAALLLPPVVEKKKGRRKAGNGKGELGAEEQAAKVQDLDKTLRSGLVVVAGVSPVVVESKRNMRKVEDCEPAVLMSAKAEVSARTTRSRSVAAAVMSPTVVENKRRKTEDMHPDGEAPMILKVPRNDSPVFRPLRNRVVQVSNCLVKETQVGKKLENKRQPSRPATRRNQQVASSVEEEDQEQVAAPSKCLTLRRSGRNNSGASNTNSETNKSSNAPVEAEDLNIAQPLTHYNAKSEDVEKRPAIKESVRRSSRKSVVSAMLENEDKDLTAEKSPEAHVRKSVVPVEDIKGVVEEIQNANGEDIVKQPEVKKPVRRSTRKSIVSGMLEIEANDLIAAKNPRRLMRKSVVLVKDIKGVGEEIQNTNGEDVVKQPAVKGPVRRSTRKSVVSAMLEKEEKDFIAEKNPRRSMPKSVVPVKDMKCVSEEIQDAKVEDVEKQLVVKQPVRRSSRKSVPSDMLGNVSGFLVAETNADRRSMRKSVLPNMLNKENQAHSKMAINEDFQSGKGGDEENQLKVKEPARRSRRSVAAVVLEKDNQDLHEGKKSELPMRRSTRKSVALYMVEKGNMDSTEMVGLEQSRVGTRNLKARVQLADHAVAVATSEYSLQAEVAVQNNQSLQWSTRNSSNHNLSDDNKAHPGPNKYVSCERVGEEGLESGPNKYVSCERVGEEGLELRKRRISSMEISSPAKDSWNTEDFGRQKFRKERDAQTPTEKDNTGTNHEKPLRSKKVSNSTTSGWRGKTGRTNAPEEVMSVETKSDDMVICEATQDGDKVTHEYIKEASSRTQEICQVNATEETLFSGPLLITLPEETCIVQNVHKVIAGLESGDVERSDKRKQAQEHCDIGTDESHLCETKVKEFDQSSSITELVPHTGIVLENKNLMHEEEIRSTTDVLILEAEATIDEGYTVDAETIEQSDEDVLSNDFTVGDCEEKSPAAGRERVDREANTSASGEKNLANIMSSGLHIKGLQHDVDILAKETGKDVVPFTITIEEHEEEYPVSLVAVEKRVSGEASASESAGKALAGILSTGLHTKDLQHDCDVLTKVTCEASETAPPITDSKLRVHLDEITEESIRLADPGKCLSKGSKGYPLSTNLHSEEECKEVYSRNELVGLYMESDCRLADKNARLVADNPDGEQAIFQVQQGDVQDGTLEKPSLCSATPEYKRECGVPEEAVLHSMKNKGCLPSAEQSTIGRKSLFLQESMGKSVEYGSLASATAHTKNGADELKDCHVKCALEKTPVSEPVLHHGTYERSYLVSKNDDCMCMSQQGNGIEGLPKVSHDEERGSSSLSGFLVVANNKKEVINSEEVACKGSRKVVHSEGHNASCEKSDVNWPADNADGSSDAVLSGSLHAPANDNDDDCLGSTLAQLESTGFLDESIGCSGTEVLHQDHKDQCNEDSEELVAQGPCTNDITTAATSKYIESRVVLLPAEERSNLQDGQLNSKLEGAKVLDNGSVAGIVCKRTPSGSGLPKDSSTDHYLRQELLDGFSVETSLEGSSTFGEKIVSRVGGTIRYPTIRLGTPDYNHEDDLSEEAVRTIKNYAGTCSSNPRQLLMELQSLFSKENIDESDLQDGLAFPGSESGGDESTGIQGVKVHLGSNLSWLESTDLLDEPIGCSSTQVLQQGHKDRCSEDKGEQIASGPCTNCIIEAATAKYVDSGVVTTEERSNLQHVQDNLMLEGIKVVGSSLDCNNDVSNPMENGFVVGFVGKRTQSGSSLRKDSPTDHYLQKEFSDDFSVDKFLEGSTTLGDKSDSRVGDTIGNSSFGLATPDYKHEGSLADEAVRTMKNYAGTCSSNPRQLLIELQSLFSKENIEESDPQEDVAFTNAESGVDESTVRHVEKLVETRVPSEPDTYQGAVHDLSIPKEKEDFMSVSLQDNEQGFLKSSHRKARVTSPQFDLPEGGRHIERYIIAEEGLCKEEEKRKSMPTSESDTLHKRSLSNGDDERALCASETQFCCSEKTSIYDVQYLCTSSSQLESLDALDNLILYSKTGVLHKHHKEEYYEHNEDQVTSGMSGAAPIKVLESGVALVQDAETSSLPDEQLNLELEGDEVTKHSFSCEEDTSSILGTGSVMKKVSHLPKDSHAVHYPEQEARNDLSAPKGPEEYAICQSGSVLGSGICQSGGQKKHVDEINPKLSDCDTEVLHQNHKEECDELNEYNIIPEVLEKDMSEAAPVEEMGSAIMLPPVARTSELPEHLNPKLESDEGCQIDSCQKQEVPDVPKFSEESANCQDESVVGSGPCQTSGQMCINRRCSIQLTSNIEVLNQEHVEHNENNEDQITPGIPASGISEDAQIESPERETVLTPVAGTSALPDEQINSKVEGNETEQHSCSYDKDTCSLFDTQPVDSKVSDLHKDTHMDSSSEHDHPNVLSAPRSPEESTVFQNDGVSKSVGISQSSRRKGIDEIRAKLQSFKVSSTVKGSYVAMSAPRPEQRANLSESAIASLRSRENTPAVEVDHPVKPDPDGSAAKDSSRRALQSVSGGPKDH